MSPLSQFMSDSSLKSVRAMNKNTMFIAILQDPCGKITMWLINMNNIIFYRNILFDKYMTISDW